MKSYSSESRGFYALALEAVSLFRGHSQDVCGRVRELLLDARRVEIRVSDILGVELRHVDMLEIGPGQFLTQMTYFAVKNNVIGIDQDVIVRGARPLAYLAMLRANGARRTLKTLLRKLTGLDSKYSAELMRQLNLRSLPELTIYAMDVCKTSFAPESFDFVYSRGVLHHLLDPASAIEEIARILRPGGVVYICIHPYTSRTGCLDPRMNTSLSHRFRDWPHLRPALRHTVEKPNVHLNRLRLADWKALFSSRMPGCRYIVTRDDDGALDAALKLKSEGELQEYDIEELVAGEFVALWQKPAADENKSH